MRLYLVSPNYRQRDGTLLKSTQYWTGAPARPTLKALPPPPWQVEMVDELLGEVDPDRPCDVGGITAMGPQIARAYELADAFLARGIRVIGLVTLGLHGQDEPVLQRTADFFEQTKVLLARFFTPAPYPGTEFHHRLAEEGRIIDDDWSHHDYASLVVEPRELSPTQLREGFAEAHRRFYSLKLIARRMWPPPPRNRLRHLGCLVANLKSHFFMRRNPMAWGAIS